MKINIGITDTGRSAVAKMLNQLLSDEYVLYTKTRNFHWNVAGPHFSELHKFFESQYDELDGIIDEVAERARSLGSFSFGSLKEFLHHTQLEENEGGPLAASKMVAALLEDHEALIQTLRKNAQLAGDKFQDAGTNDFLTGLMEQHEKMAWMLRSFLD